MRSYVLLLTLASVGTVALGQVKVKPQVSLIEEKETKMPILKLDSADEKYRMPVKKLRRMDSLAPMPGTEKMPKADREAVDLPLKRISDSLKMEGFKLKIDSLYKNRQKK
ncbi:MULTISPECIES: hypothetical protein [unclassified Sphingobacterium]|uniref:hypothetical protein n=1 Tax=unclassified Sphingobacterium TaxID=2609468 RepID=UPI0025FC93BE|nr:MULTISPECIES: hypothetical protein [unclassified Sphingobacterium]